MRSDASTAVLRDMAHHIDLATQFVAACPYFHFLNFGVHSISLNHRSLMSARRSFHDGDHLTYTADQSYHSKILGGAMLKEERMESEIVFSRKEAGTVSYGEIILNRPEKGNALTIQMLQRLDSVISEIESDRGLRAVVIRGRGRFFCTGGDIEAWGALSPKEMGRDWILYGIRVFERLAALPQPVIAAVSGHALGGGLELVLSADLRIAVESAKFGAPEVTLGMISGWMGIRRLAENIGVARARHMTLLGTPITSGQALDWGLITALADDADDLERQLNGWLERLCANAPTAMALTKGILASMHADLRQHHASAAAEACSTEDCGEGVRAFREKRKPVFRNR